VGAVGTRQTLKACSSLACNFKHTCEGIHMKHPIHSALCVGACFSDAQHDRTHYFRAIPQTCHPRCQPYHCQAYRARRQVHGSQLCYYVRTPVMIFNISDNLSLTGLFWQRRGNWRPCMIHSNAQHSCAVAATYREHHYACGVHACLMLHRKAFCHNESLSGKSYETQTTPPHLS
jgi:hypothetical protein